MPKPS
jgi:DnaJ homolog subfamily C member 27